MNELTHYVIVWCGCEYDRRGKYTFKDAMYLSKIMCNRTVMLVYITEKEKENE